MLLNLLTRFIVAGLSYMGMETLYDGTSHWSMGLVGGTAFLICVNFIGLPFSGLWMGLTITSLELIAGLIFNRNYTIWDYRKTQFNYKGQICLKFSAMWSLLMPFVIEFYDKVLP